MQYNDGIVAINSGGGGGSSGSVTIVPNNRFKFIFSQITGYMLERTCSVSMEFTTTALNLKR